MTSRAPACLGVVADVEGDPGPEADNRQRFAAEGIAWLVMRRWPGATEGQRRRLPITAGAG